MVFSEARLKLLPFSAAGWDFLGNYYVVRFSCCALMPTFTGPPPIPIRARNKETDAQLENARAAFGLSWRSILAIIVLFLMFLAFLYLLQR